MTVTYMTQVGWVGHESYPGQYADNPERPPVNTVALLLWVLERHQLGEWWRASGAEHPAHKGHEVRDESTGFQNVWVDDGPIYPEHPDAVRFWGNFETLSCGFQIDTDDPAVIELLRKAIERNLIQFPHNRSVRAVR